MRGRWLGRWVGRPSPLAMSKCGHAGLPDLANGFQCFLSKHKVSSPALRLISALHGPPVPHPLVALSPEHARQCLLSSVQGVRGPSQCPAPRCFASEAGIRRQVPVLSLLP